MMGCQEIQQACVVILLLLSAGIPGTATARVDGLDGAAGLSEEDIVSLQPGMAQIIYLHGNHLTLLSVEDIPTYVAYIVCQVHTQTRNVTLSSQVHIEVSSSVTGRDVGMVTVLEAEADSVDWYLYNNNSDTVRALVHVTYLSGQEPLPGGCNLEFNLENDPNIHLRLAEEIAYAEFQWSNTGSMNSDYFKSCEDITAQSLLEYHGYVLYIPGDDFSEDGYFKAMKKMLTAKDIMSHATELTSLANGNGLKSLLAMASYKKQGVVYGVVVKQLNKTSGGTSVAAYIPVATYACDVADMDGSCKSRDIAAVILSTIGAIVGLFICFLGHRFFKTGWSSYSPNDFMLTAENFVFGFLMFIIIFYHILSLSAHINNVGTLTLTAVFGLIGGALLLALWWYFGIPIISVLLMSLVFGYLVSSVIFYIPAMGNLSYWGSTFNYGMSFTCGTLIVPVLMLCWTRTVNIVCCAVVGAYGFVLAIDIYLNSGVRYIVVNSLRHGTNRDYLSVLVTGPYTLNEILLTVVWFVLAVSGVIFQCLRERKKAPFPPCPRVANNRSKMLRGLLQSETPPDRQPLLRGDNSRQYGTDRRAGRPLEIEVEAETEQDDSESEVN